MTATAAGRPLASVAARIGRKALLRLGEQAWRLPRSGVRSPSGVSPIRQELPLTPRFLGQLLGGRWNSGARWR